MPVLVAILLGTAVGFFVPHAVLWMRPALEPAFALTMLAVGTLVRPAEIRAFANAPLRPLVGLATQYSIMPLSAGAFSLLFEDPVVRTGVVLVGCMPGAMASNLMTVLLRGELILSVTMTTLATLLSPLVIAFWLPLLADTRIHVPVGAMAWNATWMVVLPVALGMTLRGWRKDLSHGWDRWAKLIASAAIVLILLVVVAANRDRLAGLGAPLALAMLGLNLAAYGLAFAAGTAFRWPSAQRVTLVVEVGMQNAGLGSVLALAHLGEAGAVPSAFYTVLCLVTVSLALPFLGSRQAGAQGRQTAS